MSVPTPYRISLRQHNTRKQLISRGVCTLTKTTRTSPLFKQSLIGLNEDEGAVLNFSTIPYYRGHNLLQRCHIFVVPRVLGLSSQFSFVVRYRPFCLGNLVAEHTKPPREALGRPRDQERSAQHRNTRYFGARQSQQINRVHVHSNTQRIIVRIQLWSNRVLSVQQASHSEGHSRGN